MKWKYSNFASLIFYFTLLFSNFTLLNSWHVIEVNDKYTFLVSLVFDDIICAIKQKGFKATRENEKNLLDAKMQPFLKIADESTNLCEKLCVSAPILAPAIL